MLLGAGRSEELRKGVVGAGPGRSAVHGLPERCNCRQCNAQHAVFPDVTWSWPAACRVMPRGRVPEKLFKDNPLQECKETQGKRRGEFLGFLGRCTASTTSFGTLFGLVDYYSPPLIDCNRGVPTLAQASKLQLARRSPQIHDTSA